MKLSIAIICLGILFQSCNKHNDFAKFLPNDFATIKIKNNKEIIISTAADLNHFEHFFPKSEFNNSDLSDLPKEYKEFISDLECVKYKNYTMNYNNGIPHLIRDGKAQEHNIPSSFYVFLYLLCNKGVKNKQFFNNGLILDFDSYIIKRAFNNIQKVTDNKLVNSFKNILKTSTRNVTHHLSYIDFSHNLAAEDCEVLFYKNSKYIGELKFNKGQNFPVKFFYNKKVLVFTDIQNLIRTHLGMHQPPEPL